LNVGVFGGHVLSSGEEETVGLLLDGSFVDDCHGIATNGAGVFESVFGTAAGSFFSDKLDGLDDTVDNLGKGLLTVQY
jgi:hypothetical protein